MSSVSWSDLLSSTEDSWGINSAGKSGRVGDGGAEGDGRVGDGSAGSSR